MPFGQEPQGFSPACGIPVPPVSVAAPVAVAGVDAVSAADVDAMPDTVSGDDEVEPVPVGVSVVEVAPVDELEVVSRCLPGQATSRRASAAVEQAHGGAEAPEAGADDEHVDVGRQRDGCGLGRGSWHCCVVGDSRGGGAGRHGFGANDTP